MIPRLIFGSMMLLVAMTCDAMSAPKRVLLLHSFGRDFAPWNEHARTFREELVRQSPDAIDLFEASLATARSADAEEGPFVEYLRGLFAKRRLDLVVAIGGPAVTFVQEHRKGLFSSTPAVFTGYEQRRVKPESLTALDSVVPIANDYAATVDSILRVRPETNEVIIILGDSPIERYWVEEVRKDLRHFEGRIKLTWFNELSFEEMLKRAAALPPQAAIFFALLSVDAAGVPHEEGKAVERLNAVTSAPIFSYIDSYFGRGIVGGPLVSVSNASRQAATVSARILAGELPGSINTSPVRYSEPRYDWRELQRWKISERNLPEGSEVHFRTPGIWEQYRPQLTAGIAAMLLQAGIISWLLIERRRRQFAQADASDRRREVVRLNRVTTANVLSSSIAHELNQPLGAILSNTEAAQILLKANPPDVAQLGEILSDIVRDEQRASEIILGLRNLLHNKTEGDLRSFDLNEAVRDVVKIVMPEVTRRAVVLRTVLAPEALLVRCDPIHLQQVILNVVMNGIDAMEGEPSPHNLTIRSLRLGDTDVEVRITDTGKGIPKDKLLSIFDTFVTTKPQGTGLGLPIARTILESYGGEIAAENRMRGAVFTFRLPLTGAGTAQEIGGSDSGWRH